MTELEIKKPTEFSKAKKASKEETPWRRWIDAQGLREAHSEAPERVLNTVFILPHNSITLPDISRCYTI